jgi:PAS domain S-box-containing protein
MRYGLAVVLPFLALLISWLLFDPQGGPDCALFLATVVIVALFGGCGPSLVSTGISTILGVLIAPPAWSLRISNPEDALRIALFALLGCLVSVFVGFVAELQRNLNRERSTLATILYTIGDAVITTNQDAQVTFLNDVAEAATGWDKQALGRPVDEIIRIVHEDSRSDVPNPVRLVLGSGTPADRVTNCLLVRRDGTEIPIVYSTGSIASQTNGAAGAVLAFRDISRQKEANNALIRTEKLATAGKLSATLAHEVNNPLEATSNLLLLIQWAPDLDTVRSYADAAFHQVHRAAHFVHQTLAFAKPSDRRQPVEIERVIDGVLSLHSNKILAKNAQVSRVRASDVQVHANRSELEQVISNLISNSLDAMCHGGTLHLRVTRSSGRVNIVVGDTGCGISREHLPKLFQAFFTTKSEVGVGLGLWVTKRIVDAHAGQIRVRSRTGCGTVVRVSL